MRRQPFNNVLRPCVMALAAALAVIHAACAEEDRAQPRTPLLPRYQQECAACHVAYPPGMLPAESWRRVVQGLSRHYGADASLDAAATDELSAWLSAQAGAFKRAREAPPEDRITRSAWFLRKHDEVAAAVWKRPAVKSPANCTACHAQADQGVFDEHQVRIPR